MSTELHDIVDKNDAVIGQATFDEAWQNNHIIRVVHNWIIGDDGRFLCQFRSAKKKSMPRCFDASVGGKLSAGETYEQAVLRESQEELGITVEPMYVGKFFVDIPHEYKFVAVFFSRHAGPFTGWEEEAERLEWMTWDEFDGLSARFPYLFTTRDSLKLVHEHLTA